MNRVDYTYLASVVERAQQGDRDAFAELFAQTCRKQYRLVKLYAGEDEAAKIMTEIYAYVYKNLGSLKDPKLFLSWLSQNSLRTCYNYCHKFKRGNESSEINRKQYLVKQLLALPYSEGQVLFLRHLCALSMRETADLLDMDLPAAKRANRSGMTHVDKEWLEQAREIPKNSGYKTGKLYRNPGELSEKNAQAILNDAFSAVGVMPSNVPMETLFSYVLYRKDRYGLQRGCILAIMAVFLLLPLFFYVPEVTLTGGTTEATTVSMKLDYLFPISEITAEMDGKTVAVYEKGKGLYEIETGSNGKLTVTIMLWNGQSVVSEKEVHVRDLESPVLIRTDTTDGTLHLVFTDESAMNWEAVYAQTESGMILTPLGWNDESCEVIFEIPTETMWVFIGDVHGNTLQLGIRLEE